MLRVHALLHMPSGSDCPAAYCHSDMIIVEHGQKFCTDSDSRAVHISSAGHPKYWPQPPLLACQDTAEHVRSIVVKTFGAVYEHIPRPEGVDFCQVFGFDLTLDSHGRPWL